MVHASGCAGMIAACSELQNFEAQIQKGQQQVARFFGRVPPLVALEKPRPTPGPQPQHLTVPWLDNPRLYLDPEWTSVPRGGTHASTP